LFEKMDAIPSWKMNERPRAHNPTPGNCAQGKPQPAQKIKVVMVVDQEGINDEFPIPEEFMDAADSFRAITVVARWDNLGQLFAEASCSKPSTAGWRLVKPRAKMEVAEFSPLPV
jgi:hypothetical protein